MDIHIKLNGQNLEAVMRNEIGTIISRTQGPYTSRNRRQTILKGIEELGQGYRAVNYTFHKNVPEEVRAFLNQY